jgi:ABC-type phosphate transport system substrate-binding protein
MKAALSTLLLAIVVGLYLGSASTSAKTLSFAPHPLQQEHGTVARSSPWEGLAIVVNRNNPVDNMTLWQLRNVFLGEKRWWSGNRRVVPVTLPRGAAERQTMHRVVDQMTDADLDKYFFFGVYRGELFTTPTIQRTPKDVRAFVSGHPGAIGYLRASDLDDSLKVVRINGLLPEDDGYPLRLPKRVAK